MVHAKPAFEFDKKIFCSASPRKTYNYDWAAFLAGEWLFFNRNKQNYQEQCNHSKKEIKCTEGILKNIGIM